MKKVAILVDGGFYQKRANYIFGEKSPKDRAIELVEYCHRHLSKDEELYRIFYYDCKPSEKTVYHPLLKTSIDLKKSSIYDWYGEFFQCIISKRKVALRIGELLDSSIGYTLSASAVKKLCRKEITVDDLTESDFSLNIQQKGVDMRIGLDIASMAQKKLVDQIILIAGDSDFVPAAKHARREGIDFILDPLWQTIKPSLFEHIDGLNSKVSKPGIGKIDPLSAKEGKII